MHPTIVVPVLRKLFLSGVGREMPSLVVLVVGEEKALLVCTISVMYLCSDALSSSSSISIIDCNVSSARL